MKELKIGNRLNKKFLQDDRILPGNPVEIFDQWLRYAIDNNLPEPGAIALSTVNGDGKPKTRMVLLKKIKPGGFVFYTNYNSPKAQQLKSNPEASFVIFWPQLERQIRVEGTVEILSEDESDEYFDSRPDGSKIGAWASPQSTPIPNRQYLENLKSDFTEAFEEQPVKRPHFWGGYVLIPSSIEFWQGQPDRLHDRIKYNLEEGNWTIQRLAP